MLLIPQEAFDLLLSRRTGGTLVAGEPVVGPFLLAQDVPTGTLEDFLGVFQARVVVGRAEGVQCLYFRDWEKCLAPGWDGSTDQDGILFPANTVLVACEREFSGTRFKNPSERV